MSIENLSELKKLLGDEPIPLAKTTTELKLYQALERLVARQPQHLKNKAGNKISYAAIYRESKATNGTISYYTEFKDIADKAIANFKVGILKAEGLSEVAQAQLQLNDLKTELKKEKRLKVEYRRERDMRKIALDEVVTRESELQFALYEMQCKMHQMNHQNVVPFNSAHPIPDK